MQDDANRHWGLMAGCTAPWMGGNDYTGEVKLQKAPKLENQYKEWPGRAEREPGFPMALYHRVIPSVSQDRKETIVRADILHSCKGSITLRHLSWIFFFFFLTKMKLRIHEAELEWESQPQTYKNKKC